MTNYRHQQTLRELLDEINAEVGPPTDEDYAWARKALELDE